MNKRIWHSVAVLGMVSGGLLTASTGAWASHGGPGGGHGGGGKVEQSTSGLGTLKSPWTLKAALDDALVGEEFEINTSANTPPDAIGQRWEVQYFKNGQKWLDVEQATTADGIRVGQMTPQLPLPLTMSVHAVNETTGETIDGAVTLN
jgi:hypothetical protein